MAIFRLLLLEYILANQLADLHLLIEASSGHEWQFEIYTVRAHIGKCSPQGIQWLRMAIQICTFRTCIGLPRHLVVKNGNFRFILLELILADQLADLPLPQRHLVAKNGNFQTCYCQSTYWQINWQIYSSHRGIQWPRMAIFRLLLLEYILANQLADLPLPQRHLVVRNGNLRFILLEFILAHKASSG